MIGLFSFFAGAGFLDLGFEMTGHFKTLFVNEFKPSFNHIYQNLFKFYSKIILWQRYASWLRAYRPCIHSQWSVS